MQNFFLSALLLFVCSSVQAQEQEKKLPKELSPFVTPGNELLDFIKADLNGDSRMDYVLILKSAGEKIHCHLIMKTGTQEGLCC